MLMGDPKMTAADAGAAAGAVHGLDRPLLERYVRWAAAALGRGDFGWSRSFRRPRVRGDRCRAYINTLAADRHRASRWRSPSRCQLGDVGGVARGRARPTASSTSPASATAAMPTFWLALLLMMLFAVRAGLAACGRGCRAGREPGWASGCATSRCRWPRWRRSRSRSYGPGDMRAATLEALRPGLGAHRARRRGGRASCAWCVCPRAAQRAAAGGDQ